MKTSLHIVPLLCLWLVLACAHGDQNTAGDNAADSIPASPAPPEISTDVPQEPLSPEDSTRLAELEKSYRTKKPFRFHAFSKEDSLKGYFDEWERVPFKLRFTPDTIPDYLVIYEATRYTSAYIVDGSNAKTINADPMRYGGPEEMFWNRAYRLEYEAIDVNCGDGQKELLVKYAGGHDGSDWYHWLIYRYNRDSLRANLIAEIPVMEYSEGRLDTNDIHHEEYYVDLGADPGTCVNEIRVQEGYEINKSDSRLDEHPKYAPKKGSPIRILKFDAKQNRFMEEE